VFNIAVAPRVYVQLRVPGSGERVELQCGCDSLVAAARKYLGVDANTAFSVNIFSDVPTGCSTGTSASVTVALLAALDALSSSRLSRYELAMAAYHVEAKLLGRECGVQDQLAAVYGGVNFIDIHAFPAAMVHAIIMPQDVQWELESRLVLVFVGQSHNSSDVHQQVIRRLSEHKSSDVPLERLRATAEASREALERGDVDALGAVMLENTAAQAALHPQLVGAAHRSVIDVAARHGAVGWKVNGAGGDGGSVTLLGPSDLLRHQRLIAAVSGMGGGVRIIPISLSDDGVRCWEVPTQEGDVVVNTGDNLKARRVRYNA
jgi:D-glycero-alpha-D-manno-heptose-7-phosphate kinase